MSRTIRPLALAALLAAAACTDRTGPEPAGESAQASRDAPAAARERLARRLALALRDDHFRSQLKRDLDRSPVREGKLHFQRYLGASRARATAEIARVTGEPDGSISLDAGRAPALELYLPVPEHRSAWSGDDRILVATVGDERQPPVAFSPRGERFVLSATAPPDVPVLALVPAETDFDRVGRDATILGGPSGGGSTPPAGLYMTNSHLVETFESWVKGAPEIEVHMLGQAGKSDSLTSYACAAGTAAGYFRFDQNSLDWSGNVLLMSQAQLNNYKSNHPDQNLRVFLVEDDDTSCQIKVDPARFSTLVKAVETAYPMLTGGRESGTTIGRIWKRAHAIQQLLKALASLIKTDDELIGNAVESAVVGEFYPNSNWVIKGDGNRTNGWIKLVMK
ncbi:MAG TPA: hypothetical protein VG500_03350 [Gemmatimonadales bacterium]|nr:hypothetical protein [Gemmatimonadales bacterium]